MIRVVIADDHEVVRAGIRAILAPHADIRVVAEVDDGEGLPRIADENDADVVVLDVSMPGPGPFILLERLVEAGVRVVVLSMHPVERIGMRLLTAGAAAYLEKTESLEHLVAAVRRAASGSVYVTPGMGAHMASLLGAGKASPAAEPHEALSRREYQVLVRLAAGKSVKRTAAELSLSPKTVSTYRARLLEKLGLDSTAELIRYAVERGLVG